MTKKKVPLPVVSVPVEVFEYTQERQPAESIRCPFCSSEVLWREDGWPHARVMSDEGQQLKDTYEARCKHCMKAFIAHFHYVNPQPLLAFELKPFKNAPVLKVIRQAIQMAIRLGAPTTFDNAGHTFLLWGHESAEEVYIDYLKDHEHDVILDGRFRIEYQSSNKTD